MTLSPSKVTRVAIGGRFGNVRVQPEFSAVALSTDMIGAESPENGTALMFHVPASCAAERPPAAVVSVAARSPAPPHADKVMTTEQMANDRSSIIGSSVMKSPASGCRDARTSPAFAVPGGDNAIHYEMAAQIVS
jgi:hypothetical protein